jgi:tetratricopeptide (TPR) repeat protein
VDKTPEAPSGPPGEDVETYEVRGNRPLGINFAKGNNGRVYVKSVTSTADPQVKAGDKVLFVSASFGPEVWEALNYGQVMYAIRTRSGGVYLKMEARGGDMTPLEEAVDRSQAQVESAGGNYGIGTRELQQTQYLEGKALERQRREDFQDALALYRSEDFEGALIAFENVKASEPANYISDNFSRVSDIYKIAAYNVACAYTALGQIEAGLEALEDCLDAGYDDYSNVRKDPNLARLREGEEFKELINRYDEPIFNENILKGIKNLFGGNN